MTLWKRVLVEKRLTLVPLALGAIVNAAVYGLVVYPLSVKSAGAADRAAAAGQALKAADRDYAGALALVAGKSRADQELVTFYDEVLPASLPAARRLEYTLLPALARKTTVRFLSRRVDPEPIQRDARFGRLHIHISLTGEYESFRQFLYELETSPEFIIIDTVALTQNDAAKPLAFTLELSTYYRLGANGN